jgi:single-strand DNA-binding protein
MKTNIKNSVNLIGNVGRNIEIFSFENGNKKAVCSIATSERYTNAKGESVTQTDWHQIVAWGKTAENLAQNVQKGNEISVTGKLTNRAYQAKDGITRYVTEIIVSDFFKLAKRNAPSVEATPF